MRTIYLIYERQPDGVRWRESKWLRWFFIYNHSKIKIDKENRFKIKIRGRYEIEVFRQLVAWAEKGERPTVHVKNFKDEVEAKVPPPQPNPKADDKKGLPR